MRSKSGWSSPTRRSAQRSWPVPDSPPVTDRQALQGEGERSGTVDRLGGLDALSTRASGLVSRPCHRHAQANHRPRRRQGRTARRGCRGPAGKRSGGSAPMPAPMTMAPSTSTYRRSARSCSWPTHGFRFQGQLVPPTADAVTMVLARPANPHRAPGRSDTGVAGDRITARCPQGARPGHSARPNGLMWRDGVPHASTAGPPRPEPGHRDCREGEVLRAHDARRRESHRGPQHAQGICRRGASRLSNR